MFNRVNVVFEIFLIVEHQRILVLPIFIHALLAVIDGVRQVFCKFEVEHNGLNVIREEYGVTTIRYSGAVGHTLNIVLENVSTLTHDE